MLVLSRKTDESIIINDEIEITVLACEGDKVKLGVSAPKEVRIFRKELWQAIHEQEQIAEKLVTGTEPDTFEELRKMLANEASGEEQKEPEK